MIYNRKTRECYEEKESLLLKILYNNIIGRVILKIFTYKFITLIGACYMNSRLSKIRIKKFIKSNKINMDEYEKKEYKNFDDFFTRTIKSEKRAISKDNNDLISPCDSKLSVYKITDNNTFKIKNSWYTVSELLDDEALASKYKDGYCLVFRLCVDDYHHYHYIDNGKIISNKKIKGKFHTVRPLAHKHVKVFSENTREYCLLKTENFGNVIQMEVGAMMVGKICNLDKTNFTKGEEKGYFRFGGSTVVLLFEKNKIIIDEDILEQAKLDNEVIVKLFETIGRRY